jgi:hypothetical protein
MESNRTKEQQKAVDDRVPIDEFMTSEIRRTCRVGFQVCAPRLVSIGNGETPDTTPFASIRAIDILGKYSMGKQPKNISIEAYAWLGVICEVAAKHLGEDRKYEAFANDVRATLEQMQ